jgi:hypothetical protein
LAEQYFNYYPETKSVTDGRTDMRIPIYPRLLSSEGTTNRCDITEILLNVVLNTINLT